MNVCPPLAQTVLLRSSGSRSPFSVVTTLNAGKCKTSHTDNTESELLSVILNYKTNLDFALVIFVLFIQKATDYLYLCTQI